MIKCLVALILVAAFSASALAASEKAKTRPQQRHLQWTSEHPGRQTPEHKPDDDSYWRRNDDSRWQREYWEPCNSTFREYYSWGCTGGH
jgi:hypothetical protein